MKRRIEDMEHRFSDTQAYLYGYGVLLLIARVIKSALLWLWDYLNHILIVCLMFSISLTIAGLEVDALSVALALILFFTQGILCLVLIRGIISERKVKRIEESPKVVVQNVQTVSPLSEVSEPQQNVPMHTI